MINFVGGLNNAMNMPIQRRESWSKFWIFWLIIQVGLGWSNYWFLEPYGMHQGAQADRACVGWNFFHETWDFFLPRVMENRAAEGIAGMEFPILAYLSGIFGRIFGFQFWVHRFLVGSLLSLGVWSLYKLLLWMRVGIISRWFLLSLVFLSPVFVFYTWNFLADAAALGLVFVGLYAWFRFQYLRGNIEGMVANRVVSAEAGVERTANYYFWVIITSSLFAGLLKVSMLIPFIAMCGLEFWQIWNKRKWRKPHLESKQDGDYWVIEDTEDENQRFRDENFSFRWIQILGIILVFLCVGSWYYYAGWLTNQTWNVHFLQQMNPAKNWLEFKDVLDFSWSSWHDRLMPTTLLVGLLICWIYVLLKNRKHWQIWEKLGLIIAIGTLCFFVLFAKQFRFHDYYYLVFFPWYFIALLTVYVDQIYGKFMFRGGVGILSLLGLYVYPFLMLAPATKMLQNSFTKNNYYCQNAVNETNELRQIGRIIDRLDPKNETEVLVVGDPSPNTALLMLGRKGIRLAPDFDSSTFVDVIRHKLDQQQQYNDWKNLGKSGNENELRFKQELSKEYYWQLNYNKGRRIAWIVIKRVEEWKFLRGVSWITDHYASGINDDEVRMWNDGERDWDLFAFELKDKN